WEQFVARQALNNTETPPFARHRLHRSHYQATTYQKNYRNESTGDHVYIFIAKSLIFQKFNRQLCFLYVFCTVRKNVSRFRLLQIKKGGEAPPSR
ncbi:MAG: hypothetical protein JNJ94_13360, partial [Chlorobi bacterium]|nr:hypothetical protein [Chlorobiota bacterium]